MMLAITDALLMDLAGEVSFRRGLEYFRSGQVLEVRQRDNEIVGHVQGSHTYEVRLRHSPSQFDGHCNCPASEGVGFCKHCVAVALQYRQQRASPKAEKANAKVDLLQEFLLAMPQDELVLHFVELLSADKAAQNRWLMRAEAALGKVDVKALKKRITAALPYNRHLHYYDQVRRYFDAAEAVFEGLREQAKAIPAEQRLTLVDYALERLNKALETIDDSGGFRYGVQQILQALHQQSLKDISWSRQQVAEYLFERKFQEKAELLERIPDAYVDALQKDGLEHFYRLVEQRWQALPPLTAKAEWSERWQYESLKQDLVSKAEAEKRYQDVIELEAKCATERFDFIRLTERCIQFGLWPQAESWLARAKSMPARFAAADGFQIDEQRLQIKIWQNHKDYQNAVNAQWEIFRRVQFAHEYEQLLNLADHLKARLSWREKALEFLQQQLKGNGKENRAANALVSVFISEQDWDSAIKVTETECIETDLLIKLARALLALPIKAMPIYRQATAALIAQGQNETYRQGISLLQELHRSLKNDAQKTAFGTMKKELVAQFRQKRNFVKWLDEAALQ